MGRLLTWLVVAAVALAACGEKEAEARDSASVLRQALFDDPRSGETFRTLQAYFPDNFDRSLAKGAEVLDAGGSYADAGLKLRAELDSSMLYESPRILQASPERMVALIRARERFLVLLQQRNLAECARYSATSEADILALSDADQKVFWDTQTAYYQAIGEARRQPVDRPAHPPEAFQQVSGEVAALSKAHSGKSRAEQDCQGGIDFYRALLKAPPDVAGSMYSAMLMRRYEALRQNAKAAQARD